MAQFRRHHQNPLSQFQNLTFLSRISPFSLMNVVISSDSDSQQCKTPILLLKTKSTPSDAYEDHFTSLDDGKFKPGFVSVLEHQFNEANKNRLSTLIRSGSFKHSATKHNKLSNYGGLIFTSQRAVDAFKQIINDIQRSGLDANDFLPDTLPLYVVGPATARSLRALKLRCPVLGEETGNGEALAKFILEHYKPASFSSASPPLLFAVGEKRRDIIPKLLTSEYLSHYERIDVHETVLYESVQSQRLKDDLHSALEDVHSRNVSNMWIVFFSPTGCEAAMEMLQQNSKLKLANNEAEHDENSIQVFIATIGPTTRNYLKDKLGFDAHVCAANPTPEGLGSCIRDYVTRS